MNLPKKRRAGNHFRLAWLIAQQELLSTLKTKGFWFILVFWTVMVTFILLMLSLNFILLQSNPRSSYMSLYSLQTYQTMLEEFRYERELNSWGDPVKYYVLDLTPQDYAPSIRSEILRREHQAYVENIRRTFPPALLKPDRFHFETLDEFQEMIYRDYPNSYTITSYPTLSYRKFHENLESELTLETLNEYLNTGKLDCYFVIPEEFETTRSGIRFVRPASATQEHIDKLDELEYWIEGVFTQVVRENHYRDERRDRDGRPDEFFNQLEIEIAKRTLPTSNAGDADNKLLSSEISVPIPNWLKLANIPLVYMFIMMLLFTVNRLITSTVDEKATEMLMSRCSPAQIMDGKLLGNGLIMLTAVGVFGSVTISTVMIGLGSVLGTQELDIGDLINTATVMTWLLFLILGYLFYGYIQSSLGSLCNDMKDISSVMYPLQLIYLFGVFPTATIVLFKPDGIAAQVLSYIPLFSPFAMVSKTAALPEWPEYFAIVMIMCLSVFVVRKVAMRVYEKGLLSDHVPRNYGKIFQMIGQST
ncbi:MAG: ABC transporter permease [Gammaproteobacteria bacterium]|nr:ABC transporter permease [Gammaproteobacteria bacterium]